MKLFPQLALVSAIAISGNAMAMQALDDTSLSAATGQEGITIVITPPTAGIVIDQVVVNDADGLGAAGAPIAGLIGRAGAITLGTTDGTAVASGSDLVIDTDRIEIDIDADGNGSAPVLNVAVKLVNTVIKTGDIGVSVGSTTALRQVNTVKILDDISINLGTTDLNIQLGNEVQGAMIKVDANITGGLRINNLALRDASDPLTTVGGGALSVGEIIITDAASLNLLVDTNIDINEDGLVITTNGGPSDIVLNDVRLGEVTKLANGNIDAANSVASLGDVGLFGLNMSGTTITISGH